MLGFLTGLFSKSGATPIEAIGGVLDKLFTSDEEKAQAAIVLEKLRQHPNDLQAAITKIEASHRSLFVAGGRPFIIWVCGIGLCFTFIVNPIFQWFTGHLGPNLPMKYIIDLVYALLGLGAFRTIEKFGGKTK